MRATVDAPTLFSSHEGSPRRLTLLHGSERETDTIAVAIADGQRLVRAGVRALLEREHGIAVVGEAATGEQAIALTRRTRPDVVLMDVSVPGLDCVEATRRILAELGVAVMVLTPRDGDIASSPPSAPAPSARCSRTPIPPSSFEPSGSSAAEGISAPATAAASHVSWRRTECSPPR